MSSLRDVRLTVVRDRVTDAERRLSRRYPDVADAVHHALHRLGEGLDNAYRDHCGAVDDARWAAYVGELDRGLSELDLEIARAAAGQGPATDTMEAITVHASAVELAGWRLRFSFARKPAGSGIEDSLTAAEAAVNGHRDESNAANRPSADMVVAAVDEVRRAASRESVSQ